MWIYECVKYSLINHSLPYSANCVISVRTMIAAQTVAANNWCLIHIVATVNYFVCRTSLQHPQECTNVTAELGKGDMEWLKCDKAMRDNIVLTAHLTSLRQVLQDIPIIVVYSFALFHYICPSVPRFYAFSQIWATRRSSLLFLSLFPSVTLVSLFFLQKLHLT
jgi:hypothetical protein